MKEIMNNAGIIEAILSGRSRPEGRTPVVMCVVGRAGSGKSTYIKDKVGDAFIHIDAGSIYFEVGGEVAIDFPDSFVDDINEVGIAVCTRIMASQLDVVAEFTGADTVRMQVLMRALEDIGFEVVIKYISTDLNQATIRSMSQSETVIPAVETDDFHHSWFLEGINEWSPPDRKDSKVRAKRKLSDLLKGAKTDEKQLPGDKSADLNIDAHDVDLMSELDAALTDRDIAIRLADDDISDSEVEDLEVVRAHRARLKNKYDARAGSESRSDA